MANPNKPKSEVVVKTQTSTQVQAISDSEFKDVVINRTQLRQVILSLQANQRRGLANTKSRGQVSGGGRKPWRQKGTGRARTGSIRNPIWRGGGIIFGPTSNRNHGQTITATFKRQSLASALHIQAKADKLKTVKMETPIAKAKDAKTTYPELLTLRRVLLVVPSADFGLGFRNFANTVVKNHQKVNALDILTAHNVVFVNDTFASVKARI